MVPGPGWDMVRAMIEHRAISRPAPGLWPQILWSQCPARPTGCGESGAWEVALMELSLIHI